MKLVFILISLLPVVSFSQSAKKENALIAIKVQAEPVTLLSKGPDKMVLNFYSKDTATYMEISGTNLGSGTIGQSDQVILTLSNKNRVVAKSIGLQSFQPDLNGNTYRHTYLISSQDISVLSEQEMESLRKYMFQDFIDFDIDPAKATLVKRQSQLFLQQLKKPAPPRMMSNVNLQNVAQHIGDSVLFCGNVFNTRLFESDREKAIILDFQYSLSAPKARAIIWEEDRKNFGNISQAFYSKKDVCIKGVVYLYDGTPYIKISHPSQLNVVSAASVRFN